MFLVVLAGCSTTPVLTPQPERCGNGLLEASEECDEGQANADDAACTASCVLAACGDGWVWAGVEECDEGQANANDAACTASCVLATCGDGWVQAEVEECDNGDVSDGQPCTQRCAFPVERRLDSRMGALLGDGGTVSVSGAGDVNGDGFDDLLVGDLTNNVSSA